MKSFGVLVGALLVLWTGGSCQDEGIVVTDTVVGDPLLAVPILVSNDTLKQLNTSQLSLCYEIHGYGGEIYNLVTSDCVSINAHYYALSSYLNAIDQIGVRAIDSDGFCRNIKVDVNGCTVQFDGNRLSSSVSSGGISVGQISNGVRISVPNCNEFSLMMLVRCEIGTMEGPSGKGEKVTGQMLRFEVTRGLNFGHVMSHGLVGQFWNIPIIVEPFSGLDRNNKPILGRYVINITSSMTGESRSFTGRLHNVTWLFEDAPCLYSGNRQSGPSYIVRDPNDPIIEGKYWHYTATELFSEDGFVYGLFGEDNCRKSDNDLN